MTREHLQKAKRLDEERTFIERVMKDIEKDTVLMVGSTRLDEYIEIQEKISVCVWKALKNRKEEIDKEIEKI